MNLKFKKLIGCIASTFRQRCFQKYKNTKPLLKPYKNASPPPKNPHNGILMVGACFQFTVVRKSLVSSLKGNTLWLGHLWKSIFPHLYKFQPGFQNKFFMFSFHNFHEEKN